MEACEEASEAGRENTSNLSENGGGNEDEEKNEENLTGRRIPEPREITNTSRSISSRSYKGFKKVKEFIYVIQQPQPITPFSSNYRPRNTGTPPRAPGYYSNTFASAPYGMPQQNPMPGGPQLAFFQNPIMDFSYWAPYPTNIPTGIPPGLAHLIAVDSILIMQQVNMIELFIDRTQPCTFLVLNSEGLCIFYAYETSSMLARSCCGKNRPLQIHIKDIYQNEIIYMNRLCSCSDYCSACCCLTALEVYIMPFEPVGAVIQKFYLDHVVFDIVDVDENVLFVVKGPPYCRLSSCCWEAQFRIYALDPHRTEIGLIRKQWGGYFKEILSTADVFTVSFPQDLDVRIKAIFLGAMFLINYVYYENDRK